MKICMILVPLFSQDSGYPYGIDAPESEMIFIFFRKSSQPETNQICQPFTLLHACCTETQALPACLVTDEIVVVT